MSTPELEAKQQENTDHILDMRNAFQTFKDIEFKKFKDNLMLFLAIIGVLITICSIVWYLAMFVGRTDNNAENLHKELGLLEKRLDVKFKAQADSIKSNSDLHYNNLSNKIDQQNIKIQSINEKCDHYQFMTERWINGRLTTNNVK